MYMKSVISGGFRLQASSSWAKETWAVARTLPEGPGSWACGNSKGDRLAVLNRFIHLRSMVYWKSSPPPVLTLELPRSSSKDLLKLRKEQQQR